MVIRCCYRRERPFHHAKINSQAVANHFLLFATHWRGTNPPPYRIPETRLCFAHLMYPPNFTGFSLFGDCAPNAEETFMYQQSMQPGPVQTESGREMDARSQPTGNSQPSGLPMTTSPGSRPTHPTLINYLASNPSITAATTAEELLNPAEALHMMYEAQTESYETVNPEGKLAEVLSAQTYTRKGIKLSKDITRDPEPGEFIRTVTPRRRKADNKLVADPEHPGQQVTLSALRRRKLDRKLVDDPEHPGQQVTLGTLRHRKFNRKLVVDPEHPGQQVTLSALHRRKFDRKLVADPEHPGQQITVAALRHRESSRRLVDDPEHPGQQVTVAALRQRQSSRRLVADPEHPGQQITRGALRQREREREREREA